jgi:hypothetical protein
LNRLSRGRIQKKVSIFVKDVIRKSSEEIETLYQALIIGLHLAGDNIAPFSPGQS